ncbi:MAG: hypothetical protein M3R03_10600 [Pseudomonadota bacterium]|nr:hypothetical protein [Pseudomonadota bacterium]
MQPQSETMSGVGSEVLSDAKNVGASAVNRLHSEVDARKDDAVTQAQSVSSAIEQAADGLDPNAPQWLKSAFQQGAQQVQKFASTLDQKDSRQLVNDVSDFARNSPGTFLAACAAAGFAAARVFRAGSSENSTSQLGSIGTDYSGTDNYSTGTYSSDTYSPSTTSSSSSSFGSQNSTGGPQADFTS